MPASDAQTSFAGHYPEKAVPQAPADAEPIAVSGKIITTGIIVAAPTSNTVSVFIGGEGVSIGDGLPVEPGSSLTLNVRDPGQVYCIANAAAQVLRVVGV